MSRRVEVKLLLSQSEIRSMMESLDQYSAGFREYLKAELEKGLKKTF